MTTAWPERLTDTASSAAHLLREMGFAWGVNVAKGTELTMDQAVRRVSQVPGDAIIVQMEFYRRSGMDEMPSGQNFAPKDRIEYLANLEITELNLAELFGSNWAEVVKFIQNISAISFSDLVDRGSHVFDKAGHTRMKARTDLERVMIEANLGDQWFSAQEAVGWYVQDGRSTISISDASQISQVGKIIDRIELSLTDNAAALSVPEPERNRLNVEFEILKSGGEKLLQ